MACPPKSFKGLTRKNLKDLLVNDESCRDKVSERPEEKLLADGNHEGAGSSKIEAKAHALLGARRKALEDVRCQVTPVQSCTKGSSGGSKKATLAATCPPCATRGGPSQIHTESGSCYGPTETPQGATGGISQTGIGAVRGPSHRDVHISSGDRREPIGERSSADGHCGPIQFREAGGRVGKN